MKCLMKFKCQNCNHCCSNVLSIIDAYNLGLYLSIEEVKLFPKERVSPLFGKGKPIEIVAYQINTQICPLLSKEGCLIYDQRPLACRHYPLNGDGIDEQCPASKDTNIEEMKEELEAEEEMLNDLTEKHWIYPLNLCYWIPW